MSPTDPAAGQTADFRPETSQARCPRCGATFLAQATTIVDAARTSDREALLAGSLNVEPCPGCGQPLAVDAPLLYFDTSAETALAYLPVGLDASRAEQERSVGRLANRVIDALPPERRKMYLLQPRMFFTRQSFMEAVLEANGVSREDVEHAREMTAFVDDLAGITDDDERQRRMMADELGTDPSLAPIADALAREAEAAGDTTRAQRLRDVSNAAVGSSGGAEAITLEELIAALLQARDRDQFAATVAGLRPVLDYAFFSELTRRIDAAPADERAALTALRADLLESIDDHDALVSAELERATDTLRAVLEAPNPVDATRRRARALDSAFFSVLQANIRAADEDGHSEALERLRRVRDAAYEGLEAAMTPRQRLVNQVARAPDAAARARYLDESRDILDSDTEVAMRRAAAEASAIGAGEIAQRLVEAAADVRARLAQVPGRPS